MIMTMDSLGSDPSPPLSENVECSWTHWENEISSISGLNAGSNNELYCLVEDKDIAARAVAFVVNSTRKGIVPLCANVANLLRSKRSLEKKIYLLKRENEALRSSTSISLRTSHSTSPAPPSTSSYTDKSLLHDQATNIQDRSRPCSRCSQCSSTVSYSPKFEKTYSFKGLGSSGHINSPSLLRDRRRGSSRSNHQQSNGITTQATVHHPPVTDSLPLDDVTLPHVNRKNSLPEIISKPESHIQRISPQVSKEVQCCLQSDDRTGNHDDAKLSQSKELNEKLNEELQEAKREIETLRDKLQTLEVSQVLKDKNQEINVENGISEEFGLKREKAKKSLFKPIVLKSLRSSLKKGRIQKAELSLSTALYPEPLVGCKCSACEESIGDRVSIDRAEEDPQKFSVNSNLRIQVNDHISDKEGRGGIIRYIGHLDRIGQPNMLFAGVELDKKEGSHDGCLYGKKYFFCSKDSGVFIPLQDITAKTEIAKHGSDKKSSKHADSHKTRSSNKSKAVDSKQQHKQQQQSSSSSNLDKEDGIM